jgi:phosphoribosylaminoimidazolecarboxamide formyltransferase / IMP cyclohydrolase
MFPLMAERTATEPTAPGEVKVRRALLSVSDKGGVVEFARGLAALGVELISTGGTARALEDGGLEVRSITDLTGFPEIMDGRVKTLHPKLYASLLARRDDPAHLQAADEHEVEWVDLVCVNLYPFERTVAREGVSQAEAIENIDIGGPTMIRAAAKNSAFSAVVVDPDSYGEVLGELRDSGGRLSLATRESLAARAFAYTARYDAAIARWFGERDERFPPVLARAHEKVVDLRYGENPHQRAAYYRQVGAAADLLAGVHQHGGKDLSFNNLLDLDAARRLVDEFDAPACVIVKHNNPCGCALGADLLEAYRRAFAADPMSAFGGIIAINRPVDAALAEAITGQFAEVVFAPGFSADALALFAAKPNLRVLEDTQQRPPDLREPDIKQVRGGLLVQDRDADLEAWEDMRVVTRRRPGDGERDELLFAWRVCKHVRSNAIVLARDLATAGIGAGQMSRVDSVRLALEKSTAESLQGAVLASDAYFPFSDGPQLAIDAGITAIIQPGGSVRDPEVIEAVDAAGIAMVFTDRRHFRH